ncbi:MAG: ribonuclease III [Bacteroidales bacterium]|nr:ribonuclease III [Bacteroidales bacterium]
MKFYCNLLNILKTKLPVPVNDKELLKHIKELTGIYPGNLNLYKQAFRHKSAASEIKEGVKDSNERLEYLGDAVLSSITADYLFKKFPYKDEGFLTEMRSKLVNRSNLNKISNNIGLDKLIVTGLDEGIAMPESIKGNAFEAFVGAIYIDKGYKCTYKVIINRIFREFLDINEILNKDFNFKSKLLEKMQKERKTLDYKVLNISDNNNKKVYTIGAYINNELAGKGSGLSIKAAEQNAAEHSLKKLE